MAKKNVASFAPEDFSEGGGLVTEFNGEITEARFCIWDYNETQDPWLFGRVTVEADEPDDDFIERFGEGPYIQYYRAGNPDSFVPSVDGVEPVDIEDPDDLEGMFAMRIGTVKQLNGSSNWAHFIHAAVDSGFPSADLTPGDIRCFEGVRGYFCQIPQKKRSGLITTPSADGKTYEKTLLVLTDINEAKPKRKAGKKTASKAASKSTTRASSKASDVEDTVANILFELVAAEDGEPLSTEGMARKIMKDWKENKRGAGMANAVKLAGDDAFLSGIEGLVFDADEGTLEVEE